MKCVWALLLFTLGLCFCIEHDFKGFDDTILFGINWPGQDDTLQDVIAGDNNLNSKEVLTLISSKDEKYNCHIPDISVKETSKIEDYEGPSPLELLKPLFSQKICSYRLESYWSYEVCHGRYIRQYHEDREGKQVKVQEYLLGQLDSIKQLLNDESTTTKEVIKGPLKTTKVEGIEVPYIEIKMGEGTTCDLSGIPRITRIKYVCYSHGKHEVYSFKETATCEYEIIILSTLLCEHPLFKPKKVTENIIDCLPVGGSPTKPSNLMKMEVDNLKLQHQTSKMIINDRDPKDIVAVFKVEKIEKDGETHLKLELQPMTDNDDLSQSTIRPTTLIDRPKTISDDSPVRAFLNGDNCLSGGSGWWKYEFCYGKHVIQYHVDRGGEKTTLKLGKFDEKAHIDWIKENKDKAPKPKDKRTSVSHFYSGGDVCDKTNKPRQTEVKLKCLENSSSPAQVSLYLLEPRTCHYILGVESPLICEILPLADEFGLVNTPHPLLVKFEKEREEGGGDKVFVKHENVQFIND